MSKYSQFNEEKHILAIYDEIGHTTKTLCDIGARLTYSNSRLLIEKYNYSGTLIDAKQASAQEIALLFNKKQGRENVIAVNEKVLIDNVNDFVTDQDFLSIDIDTNDWWIWAHIEAKPRVVCIEFNDRLTGLNICSYNPNMTKCNDRKWDQCASLDAMKVLGKLKGYDFIGTTGVNALFVDEDCNCGYRI